MGRTGASRLSPVCFVVTMSWIEAGRSASSPPSVRRVGGGSLLVRAELLVIRLRTAPHDRGQRVSGSAKVPPTNPASLVDLDPDDLAVADEQCFGGPVQVEVDQLARFDRCARTTQRKVLGEDQPAQRGDAEVREVDPAEQAVPVAVVRLAGVEVVDGRVAGRPGRHCVDEIADAEHLLVEVVDLAVLDLEVAPDRAAQPAQLRAVLDRGLVDLVGERGALIGGQRPLAHLGVGAGRQVDAADRAVAVEPADGVIVVSQSRFASSAVKKRSTQPVGPQQCSNVVGQPPNFSPSSPIVPTRSPASVA